MQIHHEHNKAKQRHYNFVKVFKHCERQNMFHLTDASVQHLMSVKCFRGSGTGDGEFSSAGDTRSVIRQWQGEYNMCGTDTITLRVFTPTASLILRHVWKVWILSHRQELPLFIRRNGTFRGLFLGLEDAADCGEIDGVISGSFGFQARTCC